MKILFLISGILFISLAGFGQLRIGDFLAYSSNNGLPASLYYSVLQSSDGYLWIGSSSGLVRFDGKHYRIFLSDYADTNSISDNVIQDLIEDNEQNLWIEGFYQGLSKYNLKTGHIKRYSRLSPDKTPGYGINQLMKDHDGEIWVATKGRGLGHYLAKQDSFEFFIPDPRRPSDGSERNANHVTGIAMDPSDENLFWISCFDGLYSFHKKSEIFRHYIFYNAFEDIPLAFVCVMPDTENTVWLGTWFKGLWSFDKGTQKFKSYPYKGAIIPDSLQYQVLDIQNINDSTFYMASRDAGLLSFHKRTHEITPVLQNYQLPDGSSSIDIQRISLTPDAGIFVGGNYYIYQQHPAFNRFGHSIKLDFGQNFALEHIVFDYHRNGYWAATSTTGKIIFFTKDMLHQKTYPSDGPMNYNFVDIVVDRNNDVWAVGLASGLLKLDETEEKFKTAANGFPGLDKIAGQITNIENDSIGNLWLMSNKKIFYWDLNSGSVREFNFPVKGHVTLTHAVLCTGLYHDAWIASNQGLFHCLPVENKIIQIVPDEKNNKSIANIWIKTMTVDHSGNAWLGFESDGIQVVSATDHRIISTYNLNDGLPGMQINHMATDSAGRIWAGTSAGLAVFNPGAEAGVWQLFNREDGIKRDYIDRPIITTEDGKLFFNIDEGISWLDLWDDFSRITHEPILHVVSITIDGLPYRDDILPDYIHSVDLSYATKEIRIEYAAMDWLHPFRTKYFYRIEGISKSAGWMENNQATITLTGTKPGKYVIQMYAVNGDGIKSKEFTLPLQIFPPFWLRWWFIAFCIIAILALGYAIFRYRIRQLQKLQNMRNTISTNLHDDIGASLSNIHILTVLTQRNISNKENATSYITKAGEEIQRISESLSDIVWNINPKYDDLEQLFIRMKRYAADMMDGKNIRAQIIFPDHPGKLSMPMDQRRDFYLIFKEAVNNLVKYSDATEASVNITATHNIIRVEITDNGAGFEEERMLVGNGMQNMKQRAEKWKGLLTINSAPQKGTRIVLEMKIS